MRGTGYLLLIYLVYSVFATTLILYLARTLFYSGDVFLQNVFPDNGRLAVAVNRLLVIGFYLLNGGWAALILTSPVPPNGILAVEFLSKKLGALLLILGTLHMVNLLVLFGIRRRSVTNGKRAAPAEATF